MIDFQPLDLSRKADYDRILRSYGPRGCEFSFVNLFMWGRQKAAFLEDGLVFFSQFNRKSVYLYPLGPNKKVLLDAVIEDAKLRGIPCRLTGLTVDDCAELERLYPGKFRIHFDRNSFDYVYDICDLADLKGRKFQKKRNHVNKFRQLCPDAVTVPITDKNTPQVMAMVDRWYENRLRQDPTADFHMERAALAKALRHRQALQMEGLILLQGQEILAFTLGGFLNGDTFDVNFEKATEAVDGAYPVINQAFAQYLREKYPSLRWLDREEDMGIEGLRKAKISYCPERMVEKHWACLLEDAYEY